MSYQSTTIAGNLGQDPEVRYTQSGTAVCNIRVAVNERRKVGNGWEDATEWFTVVCFGKTAENVGQYLGKGRQVLVRGRFQTRKWRDREGRERETMELIADQVVFLQGGGDRAPGAGSHDRGVEGRSNQSQRKDQGGQHGNDGGFYDDKLPF